MSIKHLAGLLFLTSLPLSVQALAQDASQRPISDLGGMLGPSIGPEAARASAAPLRGPLRVGGAPGNSGVTEDSGAVSPLRTSPRDVTENIGLNAVQDVLTPKVTRKGGAF